jgi:glutathione S-transferase
MVMKLYMFPGACSLAPHIVLRELGLPFDIEKVDLKTGRTSSGQDYKAIQPLGYVPALRLDDGQLLTEVAAIVQYLADRKPEAGLAPAAGTFERYRLVEWLNFIATELHKGFSPLFIPNLPEAMRTATTERLTGRFAHVDRRLDGRPFLLGDAFSVADAYLFTIATWLPYAKLDIAQWPHVAAHHERIQARPAVQEALRSEADLRRG